MKVNGPAKGIDAVPEPTGKDGQDGKAQKSSRAFAVAGSQAPQAPAAAGKIDAAQAGAGPKDITSDLTAELRAGRLEPSQAMAKVMERVIDRQLGVNAPAPAREKLRAALQDAIDSDPLLAEKMRGLTG